MLWWLFYLRIYQKQYEKNFNILFVVTAALILPLLKQVGLLDLIPHFSFHSQS